jgi:hypothetical protein
MTAARAPSRRAAALDAVVDTLDCHVPDLGGLAIALEDCGQFRLSRLLRARLRTRCRAVGGTPKPDPIAWRLRAESLIER